VSKFSLDVLQQRVFPYVKAKDPDIIPPSQRCISEHLCCSRVGLAGGRVEVEDTFQV